ncbi:MAG TPA: DNA primase small subunit domain-containing protein, partial [Longimicrobium sp.]|nr:DNA primase small subunit domain-containing protein [Longimicrobium sp.]
MGVLELHSWGARIDRPERPDRFVIDLDPAADVEWVRVVAAAREVRDRLAELGLRSFLKTTGGKGLHLVVPTDRRHGWDEVKDFTRALAVDLAARHPGEYVTTSTLAKRGGRIYIDYQRNGRGATAVAPFSVRNRASAAISLPIAWEELTPRLKPASFTPAAVLRRLAKLDADPWAEITTIRQSITKGMRLEVGMR